MFRALSSGLFPQVSRVCSDIMRGHVPAASQFAVPVGGVRPLDRFCF